MEHVCLKRRMRSRDAAGLLLLVNVFLGGIHTDTGTVYSTGENRFCLSLQDEPPRRRRRTAPSSGGDSSASSSHFCQGPNGGQFLPRTEIRLLGRQSHSRRRDVGFFFVRVPEGFRGVVQCEGRRRGAWRLLLGQK